MAKRLIQFLRSVLPTDPYQLLFLVGIVGLLTTHGMKWWPESAHIDWNRLKTPYGRFILDIGLTFLLPITFASVAGYFTCFWPGSHPSRRVAALVIFPALTGLVLTLARFVYIAGPISSVLQRPPDNAAGKIMWVQNIFWQAPGAVVTAFSLLLIVIFTYRIALGISNLPLSLSSIRTEASKDASQWYRIQLLVWFLVALEPLPLAVLLLIFLPTFLPWVRMDGFSGVILNLGAVAIYIIASLIVGTEGRKTIREFIAKPGAKWASLAILLPIAVDALIFFGQMGLDRFQRAARDIDFLPIHESGLPALITPFLVYSLPAFVEEVIFRGLLQARFVFRYGLYRGIFLVNIVWAASHFYSDFSFSHKFYLEALVQFFVRIVMALAIGFVLSWLTMQSHSIIPATIAHTLYNVLNSFPSPTSGLIDTGDVRIALWAVLACIHFKYWPVSPDLEPQNDYADAVT